MASQDVYTVGEREAHEVLLELESYSVSHFHHQRCDSSHVDLQSLFGGPSGSLPDNDA